MEDKNLFELIKQLVELDEEIRKRLDDFKKILKHNGHVIENQHKTDYIK